VIPIVPVAIKKQYDHPGGQQVQQPDFIEDATYEGGHHDDNENKEGRSVKESQIRPDEVQVPFIESKMKQE
jgi:hypothetical protein